MGFYYSLYLNEGHIFLHFPFLSFSFLFQELDLKSEEMSGIFWFKILFIFPILLCKFRRLLISSGLDFYFKNCFVVFNLCCINLIVSKNLMIFYEKNIFERHGILLCHFFEVNVCTPTTNNYSDTNKNEFKIYFLKGKDNMFTKMDNEGLTYASS